MEQHVKAIGIIDIVLGALGVFGGFVFMLVFLFIQSIPTNQMQSEVPAGLFASIGLIGGLFIISLSVFQIIVGIKLRQHKPWARIAQIILAVLGLPSFPIGTGLGIYFIWAMANNDTVALFK